MSFYSDASLVMIPSGYKTSKVYSAVPTDGAGDLSFSRSNDTATRVNSAGLIEKVRTNLFPTGSALLATGWTSVGATLTAGQTDPNGGTTALRVQLAAAQTPYAYIYQTFTGSAATYARSAYIKAASAQSIRITDPYSGAATTVNLTTNWQRFTAVGAGIAPDFGIQFDNNNDAAAKDFTIAFVQVETGDIATDYIATTSAAVSVGPVANVPRLDYLGSSCPRLLLEPQRTNSQTYSEDLTQSSAWGLGATTISANATTSPDGYQNADKLVEDATTARHELYGKTLTFSGTSSVSFYAKAAGRRYFSAFVAGNPALGGATYDLQTGTITATSGGTTANIEAVSGATGWYRCSFTTTVATTSTLYICLRTTGGAPNIETYAGDGTSGVYFWGGQTELAGAYATSYIPTLGAAVTRGSDDCVKSSATSIIGQTEGVVFFEWEYQNVGSSGGNIPISLDGGSSEVIYFWVQTNGTYRADVYDDGIQQVGFSGSMGSFGIKKIAIAYKNNDFALYINGVLAGTDTSGSIPTLNRLYIGRYLAPNYEIASGIKQVLLFPTRLSNSELAALTA